MKKQKEVNIIICIIKVRKILREMLIIFEKKIMEKSVIIIIKLK